MLDLLKRCPMEFSCKQTKVMFTLSFSHQNILCASLRSNKCVEYISFLIKHLQSCFFLIFVCLLPHCLCRCIAALHCMLPPPTVHQGNSRKQVSGMRFLSTTCLHLCILMRMHHTNKTGTHSKKHCSTAQVVVKNSKGDR